jgi:hypothetical protein
MVVDCQLDVVLVAKTLEPIERFRRRFGNQGLDPELAAEFEHPAAAFLVVRNGSVVAGRHADARIIHFQADLLDLVVRQTGVKVLRDFRADLLEAQTLDMRQPQLAGFVDRFQQGEAVQAPGRDGQPPADRLASSDGRRQPVAGRGGPFEIAEDELESAEIEFEDLGSREIVGTVADRAIDDPAATVAASPSQGVVLVVSLDARPSARAGSSVRAVSMLNSTCSRSRE